MPESKELQGFVISDTAIYAYEIQDVYPDLLSFVSAIPNHLKPLFLIPVSFQTSNRSAEIAHRISARGYIMSDNFDYAYGCQDTYKDPADLYRAIPDHIKPIFHFEVVAGKKRRADGYVPTGETDVSDLFGYKTFVYDDNEPNLPSTEPGSIFDAPAADEMTHHQEYDFDQNIQAPTDTSYMTDVDMSDYFSYPYRTEEKPIRHSSINRPRISVVRLALKPEDIENRTPDKIQQKAESCSVSLVSYNKETRVYTFTVDCGNVPRTVQASLSSVDEVALSCDCPFWRWNGPEFHAKQNKFMLGDPFGTASPPDVRDPDRKYWLCKHAYIVLRRLDNFVQEVLEENWDEDDAEALSTIDKEWDRLDGKVTMPVLDAEDGEDDFDVNIDWGDKMPQDENQEQTQDSTEENAPDEENGPGDEENGPEEGNGPVTEESPEAGTPDDEGDSGEESPEDEEPSEAEEASDYSGDAETEAGKDEEEKK